MSESGPDRRHDGCGEHTWAADLPRRGVGRASWVQAGATHTLPVAFVRRDGRLYVRTSPYSRLLVEGIGLLVVLETESASGRTTTVVGVAARAHRSDQPLAGRTAHAAGGGCLVLLDEAQHGTSATLLAG